MTILIIGGSGSGKSGYAEKYIGQISGDSEKYYIATMRLSDSESRKKAERHRKMREPGGFVTIEQPVDIERAADRAEISIGRAALLECVSNLTANEMFTDTEMRSAAETADKVVSGIENLVKRFRHTVIVTNNIFEDGTEYDGSTAEYIKALGEINKRLAGFSDRVIEVVVGIPVVLKEED